MLYNMIKKKYYNYYLYNYIIIKKNIIINYNNIRNLQSVSRQCINFMEGNKVAPF